MQERLADSKPEKRQEQATAVIDKNRGTTRGTDVEQNKQKQGRKWWTRV